MIPIWHNLTVPRALPRKRDETMTTWTNSQNETTHSLERKDSRGGWRVSVCKRNTGRFELVTEFFPARQNGEAPGMQIGGTMDRDVAVAFWKKAKAQGYR
jgi:hypothetical protein